MKSEDVPEDNSAPVKVQRNNYCQEIRTQITRFVGEHSQKNDLI